MAHSFVQHIKKASLIVTTIATLSISQMADAGVIVGWDFENAAIGQQTQIASSYSSVLVSNAHFNTFSSGVEQWGSGNNSNKLALTRYFDSTNNTPWFTFTLNDNISNLWLSFNQSSNHNPGFPTSPRYNFAVQIQVDNVWKDIKRDLVAQTSTFGQLIDINVASTLKAGTHSIRWIGYNYSSGTNSNTEFFGLDNVNLYTVSEPAAVSLLGLALMGLYRRQRHLKAVTPTS